MINYELSRKQFHKEITESNQFTLKFLTIPKDIKDYISLPISPYLSLQISDFFNISKDLMKFTETDLNFKKSVDTSRNYWKFYTDQSITKTKKIIEESIIFMEYYLTKDYNLLQKLYVKLFNQDNFGVFYYRGLPFFNTIQGQEISNAIVDSLDTRMLPNKNEIIDFASSLTSIIKTIKLVFDENFGEIYLPNDNDFLIDYKDINYKDFYLNVTQLGSNDFTLVKQIVLFNILCNINYHQTIAPNYMSLNNDFFFRIKLITYISSCESLRKLMNKEEVLLTKEEMYIIEEILNKKEKLISCSLRNNAFHYLIDIPESNSSKKLKEIFSTSTSIDINKIGKVIDDELEKIRKICIIEKFIYE